MELLQFDQLPPLMFVLLAKDLVLWLFQKAHIQIKHSTHISPLLEAVLAALPWELLVYTERFHLRFMSETKVLMLVLRATGLRYNKQVQP
jgi:hypothetical protein